MGWQLRRHPEHSRFPRNPIAASIVQLRFHPILKVRDELSAFQDLIRERFPRFATRKSQEVSVEIPNRNVSVTETDLFEFTNQEGTTSLNLRQSSLALENRRHRHHEEFLKDFSLALDALSRVYGRISPTRVGMRYINIIRREQVSNDLAREVDWDDLVKSEFFCVPPVVTLERTTFANEVSSSLEKGGMTLRYGMLKDSGDEGIHFRLDIDRYMTSEFDADATVETLTEFSDDIYALFMSAAEEGLIEWMSFPEE